MLLIVMSQNGCGYRRTIWPELFTRTDRRDFAIIGLQISPGVEIVDLWCFTIRLQLATPNLLGLQFQSDFVASRLFHEPERD
jgi:hypothetical protein